jgi:hypothetical protein
MLWTSLQLALHAIRRNLMRSTLTVLGIVIGVAAVIVMVSIGQGATARVAQQISASAATLLMVTPAVAWGPASRWAPGRSRLRTHGQSAGSCRPSRRGADRHSDVDGYIRQRNWSTSVVAADEEYLAAPVAAREPAASSAAPNCGPGRPCASSAPRCAPSSLARRSRSEPPSGCRSSRAKWSERSRPRARPPWARTRTMWCSSAADLSAAGGRKYGCAPDSRIRA